MYPILLTQPTDNITSAGARFNGKFESVGAESKILDHGFVWNMQSDPMICNSSQLSLGNSPTQEFSGMGTEGMVTDKTHYVRSYVITDRVTIYGTVVGFKSAGSPTSWKKISDTTPLGNALAATSFVDNGKIYFLYNNSFYAYDVMSNTWTPKAAFPASSRTNASGFIINGKFYYGFGKVTDYSNGYYNDLYSYDPLTNMWTTVLTNTSIPARAGAVTFVIGNKAYIGFGESSSKLNDFYEFNPVTLILKPIPNTLVNARSTNTSSFTINGKGYFLGVEKQGSPTSPSTDLYEFDPTSLAISRKADFPNIMTATNNVASATTGYIFSKPPAYYNNKIYGFDPVKNVWTANEIFTGSGRILSTGVFLNGKIYFGLGVSVIPQYYDVKPTPDFWEFTVK